MKAMYNVLEMDYIVLFHFLIWHLVHENVDMVFLIFLVNFVKTD